ncbi:MAG: hypothetical protein OHK0012_01580 [Synechococcales cyanobacterium]
MLSTMNTYPVPSWQATQRMHLWRRLQQRLASAQHNPTLLALLEDEAAALSLGEEPANTRRDRTIASLQHLRVDHAQV